MAVVPRQVVIGRVPVDLKRFHIRFEQGWQAIALKELTAGRKPSHWIWWVFPQLDGLSNSSVSERYALEDDDAARDFLDDELLRHGLVAVTAVVRQQLEAGRRLVELMGGAIDAHKLVSSLTLFASVCDPDIGSHQQLAVDCAVVLRLAAEQGLPPCTYTRDALGL